MRDATRAKAAPVQSAINRALARPGIGTASELCGFSQSEKFGRFNS
jgi:hypothetical protein